MQETKIYHIFFARRITITIANQIEIENFAPDFQVTKQKELLGSVSFSTSQTISMLLPSESSEVCILG
ncbi:hypothetical protein [Candidatus Uabimicrobium sp. HlEnr_7]|uniref:hypothetical protein n=1 Tax=Candidatus Uabimicrobium helgolandensis TaxID=3095367 RepID=UPI003556A181